MRRGAFGLQEYLLLSVAFVAVFALIPFELYFTGREYWSFPQRRLFGIVGWGLAGYLACCAVLRAAAIWRAGLAAGAARALFCIGLFVLLADLYAPLQATPLDGSELRVTESVLHIAIEAALFLLACALFVAMTRRPVFRTIAAVFSVLLLLTAAGYAGAIVLTGRDADDGPAASGGGGRPGPEGNVYHILLDRMQSDVFLHVLERRKLKFIESFDGFELFRNNLSNYLSTNLSLPSYFTGTLARTADLEAWSESWKERGLLPGVVGAGYRLTMYVPREGWENGYARSFVVDEDVYRRRTGIHDSGLQEFTFIWLVRLAPAFLTEETAGLSDAFRRTLFPAAPGGVPVTRAEGLAPFAGSLLLRQMIEDEARRAPAGEYVYMHAVLPHMPYVLDEDCRYRGPVAAPPRSREWDRAHLLQAECALRLVTAFLAELERLGRLDRSLVIVHADTGSGDGFVSLRRGVTNAALRARRQERVMDVPNALGWSNEDLIGRALALLMVKPPHAAGPLRISGAPTQLVDLYPTIVDLLSLDEPDYPLDGRSVYGLADGERRDIRIGFDPSEVYGDRIMEVRVESPTDPFRSALTLVGAAADMPGTTGGRRRAALSKPPGPAR